MNAFVQQEWTDSRLNFHGFIDAEYLELDANLIKSIWVPDLYFTNEKVASFHDVTVPNKMLHLFSNGRIVYRLRYEFLMSLLENLCIDYFCLQKNLLIYNCEDLHKTNKRSYNSQISMQFTCNE
jgi:hypothetical protein